MSLLQTIIDQIQTTDSLIDQPTYNIFKNDQGYYHRIEEFKNRDFTNNHIGLIIGPGSAFSILPEVPCQNIIVCDINLFVINSTRYTQTILQASKNILDYFDCLYKNNPYHQQIINRYGQDTFCEIRDNQIWALQKYHLEYSNTRFTKCKESLKTKNIYFLPIDIGHQSSLNQLANKLVQSNYQISFADFSNVHEYIFDRASYASSLNTLPFTNQPTIIYSSIEHTITSQPSLSGIAQYISHISIN